MAMPNDPRGPNAERRPEGLRPGCLGGALVLVCAFLVLSAAGFSVSRSVLFGAAWILLPIAVFLVALLGGRRRARKTWGGASGAPGEPQAASGEDETEFRRPAAASGPEQGPARGGPEPGREAYRPPAAEPPEQLARRLQNLRELYEAGLLTREEYADETRRTRGA